MPIYILFLILFIPRLYAAHINDLTESHIQDDSIFSAKLTRHGTTIKISVNSTTGYVCITNIRKEVIKEYYIQPQCTFLNIRRPIKWRKNLHIEIETNNKGIFKIPFTDTACINPGEAS